MIYIKEAHASDGWVSGKNKRDGIEIPNHKSFGERSKVSLKACEKLNIDMPNLVDDMKDSVNTAYSAWPDRLYLIGTDGKIAVMGDRGPRGFPPSVTAARAWLKDFAATK